MVARQAMIPYLPEITLTSRATLRLHESLPEITPAIQAALREHELVIHNPNRVELFNLKLLWNLPETVAGPGHHDVPGGANIRIEPVQPANEAIVRGNAKVTMGGPVPTQHFRLEIDRVPATSTFRFAFYTVKPQQTMPYELCKMMPDTFDDPEKLDEHKVCYFFLKGTYQFLLRNEFVTATMFVPLIFKSSERTITSCPIQVSHEPYRLWRASLTAGATIQLGGSASQ